MGLITKIRRELKFVKAAKTMLAAVDDIDGQSKVLIADDIEKNVDLYPGNLAFISDDKKWTYQEFDAYANKVAHWALEKNCKVGDTVAVFLTNRHEYVAIWYGLSKVGVLPALINYQLRSKALAHCVCVADAQYALVDATLMGAWESAKEDLPANLHTFCTFGEDNQYPNFCEELESQNTDRPDKSIRADIKAGDLFMKMFTSGTTGLPKAAKVTHVRAQYYMRGFVIPSGSTAADRMMMVLPLYHATGGLCGVGVALMKGGAVIVREKFSATKFWDEAVQFEATLFMYVGELCRFLLNTPPNPNERLHKIRTIVGNGMRPEVWGDFVTRFNVSKVIEFYGATEGNISLINFEGKQGSVGRIPEYLRKKYNGDIIGYDVETGAHIKTKDGFFKRANIGEIGELIGEIKQGETRFRFEGYESKKASAKKILCDVFKTGDRWFRTGDLLWRDKEGYYYFADRIGDTFRWKAENVSTNEVAASITGFAGVEQANVYGVSVPEYDGKAGMASLVVGGNIDLIGLYAHIENALPPYARPVFLRINREDTDTTGTFKYKKTDLVKAGFDPANVSDDLYVNYPETKAYEKLTPEIFTLIEKGKIRF